MNPDTDYLLNDLAAWIRRRLETIEYRSSYGFNFSAVPESELRQKLEAIENLKTSGEPKQPILNDAIK